MNKEIRLEKENGYEIYSWDYLMDDKDIVVAKVDTLFTGYETFIYVNLSTNDCFMTFRKQFGYEIMVSKHFNYFCKFTSPQFNRCCNAIKWICVQHMVDEILDGMEWVKIEESNEESKAA